MWYRGTIRLSASATATARYLHEVDLAAAAGNVVLTVPTGIDPLYFGVTNSSAVGNGSKVIILQTAALVEICRLSAAGESVWVGWNPATGAWEQIAHDNPSPYQWTWADATARLATLVSAAQVGKRGWQSDIALAYELLDDTPLRWGELLDPQLGPLHTVIGIANVASFTANGLATSTAGALTARPMSGVTPSRQLARTGVATGAGAGSFAYLRSAASGGVASAFQSLLGWRQWYRTVLEPGAATSLFYFVGFTTTLPAASTDPVNFLNCIGIGRSATDANLQLMHNDGAGLCVKLDLGAAFPAIPVGGGYELMLHTLDGTSYAFQVRNLDSAAEISSGASPLVADVPAPTAQPLWLFYSANNTDAIAVSADVADLRIGQRTR